MQCARKERKTSSALIENGRGYLCRCAVFSVAAMFPQTFRQVKRPGLVEARRGDSFVGWLKGLVRTRDLTQVSE